MSAACGWERWDGWAVGVLELMGSIASGRQKGERVKELERQRGKKFLNPAKKTPPHQAWENQTGGLELASKLLRPVVGRAQGWGPSKAPHRSFSPAQAERLMASLSCEFWERQPGSSNTQPAAHMACGPPPHSIMVTRRSEGWPPCH